MLAIASLLRVMTALAILFGDNPIASRRRPAPDRTAGLTRTAILDH
jgi:hypothetical protein